MMNTTQDRGPARAGLGAAAAALGLTLSLAGAPLSAQDSAVISANLFGDQVVADSGAEGESPDAEGNPDGNGDFNALVDRKKGQICYYLEADGVGEVTAAHIHSGAVGKTGEAVVTLEMAEMDERCVTADPALVGRMARSAGDYYVDIHTAERPAGALRGQMTGK